MGITDCASAAGTEGRLTSVVPSSTRTTCQPDHATAAKKAMIAPSATSTTATRARPVRRWASVGTPTCARRSAASAAP